MRDKMKKYVMWFALFICFPLAWAAALAGTGDTDVEKIERRLPKTSGEERLKLLLELSEYYLERDAKKALTCGMEALELLRDFPNPKQQVTLYNYIGSAHSTLSHHEEARKYVKLAQELAENIDDQKGYADALKNLALIYYNQRDFDRSTEYLSRTMSIYEKLGDEGRIAEVFHSMGNIYFRVSDHVLALENYLKAANIYDKLGKKDRLAAVYNNVGVIYQSRGDY
jgi:tetratricopeptide (TPR) repeat protein